MAVSGNTIGNSVICINDKGLEMSVDASAWTLDGNGYPLQKVVLFIINK